MAKFINGHTILGPIFNYNTSLFLSTEDLAIFI